MQCKTVNLVQLRGSDIDILLCGVDLLRLLLQAERVSLPVEGTI